MHFHFGPPTVLQTTMPQAAVPVSHLGTRQGEGRAQDGQCQSYNKNGTADVAVSMHLRVAEVTLHIYCVVCN